MWHLKFESVMAQSEIMSIDAYMYERSYDAEDREFRFSKYGNAKLRTDRYLVDENAIAIARLTIDSDDCLYPVQH